MKGLQLEYITEEGKEAINNIIDKTKKDYKKGKINSGQKALYDLFVFSDGKIIVKAIDPSKAFIVKMFIKPQFKKMLKKDGCKLNRDYLLSIEEI